MWDIYCSEYCLGQLINIKCLLDVPFLLPDFAYHFEIILFFFLILKHINKNKSQIIIFYWSLVFHYDYPFDVVHAVEQMIFLKSHY